MKRPFIKSPVAGVPSVKEPPRAFSRRASDSARTFRASARARPRDGRRPYILFLFSAEKEKFSPGNARSRRAGSTSRRTQLEFVNATILFTVSSTSFRRKRTPLPPPPKGRREERLTFFFGISSLMSWRRTRKR